MSTPSARSTFAFIVLAVSCPGLARGADYAAEVTINASVRTPISPYIYGSNQDLPNAPLTARRQGGNRMTGYNWENNASNAGSDYFNQSDNYLTWVSGLSDTAAAQPGLVVTHFHDQSLAAKVPYSLVTLPIAGYVAKDKAGPVSEAQVAPSTRWVPTQTNKGSPFSTAPDLNDGFVYTDELIHFLTQRYGSASSATGIKGYSLDNEPALWSHTHARLHPNPATCAEILSRGIDVATAVKRLDAPAEVFGPVLYGLSAYIDFQSAPDWPTEKTKGNYEWFVDYYLGEMNKASAAAGTRLLDVFDVHLYSEQRGGGERITDSTNYSNVECNKARLQAPRSLWDSTFVENSWLGQYQSWTFPFVRKLKASIDAHYPGTKLAYTEYNFGGGDHISGGIAQADTLGIFGAEGVYMAMYWQLREAVNYASAAFQLYRNYDGNGGTFGDTSLATTSSSVTNLSAYASVSASNDGRAHVILLNKNYDDAGNITVRLDGARTYTRARVFGFDAASATLREFASLTSITGNQFVYRIPALTAVHLVLESSVEPPPPPPSGQSFLVNLSTRAFVGTGDRVLIGGFVTTGSGSKRLLIRGVGPTLANHGLSSGVVLANPQLTLTDVRTKTVVTTNDDWGLAGNADEVAAAVAATGMPFAAGSKDAAIVVSLPSGPYTVTISGTNNTTGIALVEVYDLEPGSSARVINLSSRAAVGTGAEVMIAGFVLQGSASKKLLVRAAGPSLTDLGVVQPLADPRIELTTATGAPLATNDDWSTSPQAAEIALIPGPFAFEPGSKDAALLTTRETGRFTGIVTGANNSTGIALVEVYEAP